MSGKILFDGLTRSQMIYKIHMECDTSSWCYKADDEKLIRGYVSIFGEEIQCKEWELVNSQESEYDNV